MEYILCIFHCMGRTTRGASRISSSLSINIPCELIIATECLSLLLEID